jgi:DNA-binding response OmpR family regulator
MKRILIVEDQADIRKLIRMTLEFEDYEIHEASEGTQGLHLARGVRPDLMLLDVMMPGEMDGLQVCQAIKSDVSLKSIKVVLLTARGQARDREAGQTAGADEYLVKPFSPLQLIDVIEQLLSVAACPRSRAAPTHTMNTDAASEMRQLQLARDRMQALLNGLPDAVLGLDPAGRVVLITVGGQRVRPGHVAPGDLTMEQLVPGQGLGDPETRTLEGMYLRSSGVHVARFEADAQRVDGTEFPAEVSLSRIETAGGCALRLRGARRHRAAHDLLDAQPVQPRAGVHHQRRRHLRHDAARAAGVLRQPGLLPHHRLRARRGHRPQLRVPAARRPRPARAATCCARPSAPARAHQVVLRNYRKDGTLFFNELAIAPVTAPTAACPHYVGVLNDVTERERTRHGHRRAQRAAERGVRPQPRRLRGVRPRGRAGLHQPRLHRDDRAGPAGRRRGLTMAAFDQRFRLCDPASLAAVPPRWPRRWSTGTTTAGGDAAAGAPSTACWRAWCAARPTAHGETILFFRDITRETEVDRMKSEFLTTAAHELRTPMVSVFGFTELLLNRPVPEERRRDMLETIHRQASLLINMVNELLDLARIEARQGKDLKREPAAWAPDRPGRGGAPGARRPTGSSWLPHADAQLWVDPEKIHRALTNVLSNAFKYSPAGGEIEVAHAGRQLDGQPRWACACRPRHRHDTRAAARACSSASTAPTRRATSPAPAWA